MGLRAYPLLRVLRLAVSPLRRVTFDKRLKSNQKVLPQRSALAGARVPSLRDSSGGIASGLLRCTSSRCVRLRRTVAALPPPDKSLHSACRRGRHGKIKSFRRADTRPLSGAASPRAVHTVKNCGSQPVGDGGLTADQFPTDHPQSNCGSGLAREGGLIAEQSPTECTPSNCRSQPAGDGGLIAEQSPTECTPSNSRSQPAGEGGLYSRPISN